MLNIPVSDRQIWFLKVAISHRHAVVQFDIDDAMFKADYGITKEEMEDEINSLNHTLRILGAEIKEPKRKSYAATKSEIKAIEEAAENMQAMLGTAEPDADADWRRIINGIDRFLTANGLERKNKGR